jgi:hypothetical protein
MEQATSFSGTDPLYLTVMKAHQILQHLCSQVRYLNADRTKMPVSTSATSPKPTNYRFCYHAAKGW